MIGEKAVRTSARFIWLAAEFSPWRMTSVVTGSASATPALVPAPARWTTVSGVAMALSLRSLEEDDRPRLVDAPREAAVDVGGGGLLEQDRGTGDGVADGEVAAVDDGEVGPVAVREGVRAGRARPGALLARAVGRLARRLRPARERGADRRAQRH